ncbi:lysosomal cystine transporter [Pyrenophora seminiperda CCB06]|uniref:Lysosomal cystine transporter n=1 Tax=Pyrenophora seminiperda CCB06 TaxID=1302712 RepID=A0A3M7M9X7_9PLEO|nr:lysosomal cystine transporter [Pyrenophora seminiperda CCB06]
MPIAQANESTLIPTTTLNNPSPFSLNKDVVPSENSHPFQQPRNRFTRSEQTDSIFFRLPAELRNQIYEELLCAGTPSRKALASDPTIASTPNTSPVYPAILSTCKRIHEEAQDLPYTTHIFNAHASLLTSLPHLTSPAKPVLDATHASKIQRWKLSLRLDTDPRFTAKQATAAFTGAEYLEIHVWQSMFDGCDDGVLRLFLDVRGVGVARVTGCADEARARLLEERMMTPSGKDEDQMCICEEVVCGKCGKKVCGGEGMEWFGRDAWTFGNR